MGKLAEWAQGAISAHTNAIENLAIFAPIVLTAHVLGNSNPATKSCGGGLFLRPPASTSWFIRPAFAAARTLAFTAGWLAQIVIIASILRWI